MKRILIPVAGVMLSFSMGACLHAAAKGKSADSMSDLQKQSYAAGYAQGGQLRKMDTELNVKFSMTEFQRGFNDAFEKKEPALNNETMEKSLLALQKNIMEKQRTYMDKQIAENKKKGQDFLTKVKQDNPDKVKELSDGILYEVIKASTSGKSPTIEDTVEVSYVGTTIDGKVFDKSDNAELKLKDLIKGWQTAIPKMKPGDKWKLYIPADQAYDERIVPGILPNSALVFDIELHGVVKNDTKSDSKPVKPNKDL